MGHGRNRSPGPRRRRRATTERTRRRRPRLPERLERLRSRGDPSAIARCHEPAGRAAARTRPPARSRCGGVPFAGAARQTVSRAGRGHVPGRSALDSPGALGGRGFRGPLAHRRRARGRLHRPGTRQSGVPGDDRHRSERTARCRVHHALGARRAGIPVSRSTFLRHDRSQPWCGSGRRRGGAGRNARTIRPLWHAGTRRGHRSASPKQR